MAKTLDYIRVNTLNSEVSTVQSDAISPNPELVTTIVDLKQQFADLFNDSTIGTFPCEPYDIQLDPDIKHKKTPPRPVAAPLQDMFKKELQHMIDLGVIVEVNEVTPWINSFVIVETKCKDSNKIEKIRICLDPVNLNKACQREPYYYRTLEDVLPNLCNSRLLFSD